ncbi:MAG: methyltransferase domain-containing protein [Candidatus Aenigmatarchaeota archaeon]
MLYNEKKAADWIGDHPLINQLVALGLTINDVIGKRVLDVGCGQNPQLVEYLRKYGIHAYGIDPEAPNRPYVFRKRVDGVGDFRGVPVNDYSYDVVLMHMFSPFYAADSNFVSVDERAESHDYALDRSIMIFKEMLRIVKPTGRIIYYPSLRHLEEFLHEDANNHGFMIVNEDISENFSDIVFDVGKYLELEYRYCCAVINRIRGNVVDKEDPETFRTLVVPIFEK